MINELVYLIKTRQNLKSCLEASRRAQLELESNLALLQEEFADNDSELAKKLFRSGPFGHKGKLYTCAIDDNGEQWVKVETLEREVAAHGRQP